jgi:hypothetical protein
MAADLPEVATDTTTNIEEYSVTFNGVIMSTGGDASCDQRGFAAGTSSVSDPGNAPYYSSGYPTAWPRSGTFGIGFFSIDSEGGHSPGTRYYCRAFVHNSFGWAWGDEVQYLTKPLAPSGFNAVSGGDTEINLTWTKGTGAGRTEIRRQTGGYPAPDRSDGEIVYFDTGSSYTDTGLTTGTHYYYRAWSEKTVDSLTRYSDDSVFDMAAPGVVLPAVTTLPASSISGTGAQLNGEITDTGGENCHRGFEYKQSDSPLGYNSWNTTSTYGTGTYGYTIPIALQMGTKHQFRAFAYNVAGRTNGSLVYFLTKPYQVTNLQAISAGISQIDLTWTKHVSSGRTLIMRKAGSAPADRNDGTQVYFDSGTSYSDAGLAGNTQYHYRAWAEKTVDDLQQYANTAPTVNATTEAQQPQNVDTATGTGTATFAVDAGTISNLTATNASSTACLTSPPGVSLPHGMFSFNLAVPNPGDTATITITLPSNLPANTQYWKCINGQWVDCTSLLGSNDGDNILTLTITDGGLGDADGIANGTIVDPGGPAIPNPAPTITSVNPDHGSQGQTLDVTITGTNFTDATSVRFGALGSYVSVNNFTVGNDTQITANITILSYASPGTRNVTVTTPAGTGTLIDGFTVNRAGQQTQSVNTATGTGTATFTTDGGSINNLTASATMPCGSLAGLTFPHGFFSFSIANITPGSQVTITITLPSNMPTDTQYWKCINGQWLNVTSLLDDNDGDNVLTLTLTDGGLGDADEAANGTIVDPGGPAIAAPALATPALATPAAPRSSPAPQRPLSPAQISLQYLSVSPQQTSAGQPVTIITNVVNTGDEAGNYYVALKINGQAEQSRTVSVGPHGSQPVKFTITKSRPGTYTVDVGGQRGNFTVGSHSGGTAGPSTIGGMIAIIIVGVLVLATLVALVMTFRRPA